MPKAQEILIFKIKYQSKKYERIYKVTVKVKVSISEKEGYTSMY